MSLDPLMDPAKGKELVFDFKAAPSVKPKAPTDLKNWEKPPPGWVKLNVDGSFQHLVGLAGAGMLLRDEAGQIVFSAC